MLYHLTPERVQKRAHCLRNGGGKAAPVISPVCLKTIAYHLTLSIASGKGAAVARERLIFSRCAAQRGAQAYNPVLACFSEKNLHGG
jgi:hypothetical protein